VSTTLTAGAASAQPRKPCRGDFSIGRSASVLRLAPVLREERGLLVHPLAPGLLQVPRALGVQRPARLAENARVGGLARQHVLGDATTGTGWPLPAEPGANHDSVYLGHDGAVIRTQIQLNFEQQGFETVRRLAGSPTPR
jgi:hypothetical protein